MKRPQRGTDIIALVSAAFTEKPPTQNRYERKAVVLLLCDVFLLAVCPRASIKLHRKGQMTLMVF